MNVFLFSSLSQAADPAEAKTIERVIRERGDLSTFLQLLGKNRSWFTTLGANQHPADCFVSTAAAFVKLPEKSLSTLLDSRNDDRLEEVFGFHVLSRLIPAFGLEKLSTLKMTTGQFLSIDYINGKVGSARFTGKSISCSNGTIYLVDQVLTPNTDDLFQRLQKEGRFIRVIIDFKFANLSARIFFRAIECSFLFRLGKVMKP